MQSISLSEYDTNAFQTESSLVGDSRSRDLGEHLVYINTLELLSYSSFRLANEVEFIYSTDFNHP